MWQSEKTNNGKIPGPIRYKREKLLELFGRNIKRISLNKNDLIHGKKKKRNKVNIVGGPGCIKNKSRKRKREEEEKKATEKGINDAINYSIS